MRTLLLVHHQSLNEREEDMQIELELEKQINIFRGKGPDSASIYQHFRESAGFQVLGRKLRT